jgi:hypothetical protein
VGFQYDVLSENILNFNAHENQLNGFETKNIDNAEKE